MFPSQDFEYKLDSDQRIWVPGSGAKAFIYSDGPTAEDYVHRVILEAKDVRTGSDELRAAIRDWASLCHLSPSRANLLRPLRPYLTGDVLEVGCGCGALTRYLGEIGAQVTAVEGSEKRAAITAARCRDLKNVTVICDQFSSLKLGFEFDCVLLVGVLEYCQFFESGPQPALQLLSRCRNFLKPGGRVIVAIENRYGLKYFAGVPEDHLGLPYVGIESRYSEQSAITWSRVGLIELMREAELSEISEFYPFPDYKLPRVVFSKTALDYGAEIKDLLSMYGPTQHSATPFTPTFSEALTWPGLLDAQLVPELSNSFLFVGSDSPQERIDGAFYYSTERRRPFQHQITFRVDEAKLQIERMHFFKDSTLSKNVCWKLNNFEFVRGTLYSTYCSKIVGQEDWTVDQLTSWADTFYKFLGARSRPDIDGALLLEGTDIDCVPTNMVVKEDGSLCCFDLEFSWLTSLPLNYVLFRGIFVALGRTDSVAFTRHVTDFHLLSISRSVLSNLGILLSEEEISNFLERESEFHFEALGARPTPDSLASLALKVKPSPMADNERQELARQLDTASTEKTKLSLKLLAAQQAVADFERKQEELEHKQEELIREHAASQSAVEESYVLYQKEQAVRLNLERSKSWRLTEPLRSLARRLRGQ